MEEKKQIEKLLVEGFRTFCPDFPKGKVTPSESPDFIVRLKYNRFLGLELTRLHPEHPNGPGEEEKLRLKTEEEIVENAREIFGHSSGEPLFVKFLFSTDFVIDNAKTLSISANTVRSIRTRISNLNRESFSSIVIPENELPRGIKSVLILKHPALGFPVWEKANNLGVSDDIISDIRYSIMKKDEKLRLYHRMKLHLYWLLITTDRLQGISTFNIDNKIVNHSFTSRFQHVYLYELMKERVFRLV